MKNKLGDLRDHLFASLERLGQEDLTDDNLKKEISRAQAISEIGKVIVESAKTQIMYARLTKQREEQPDKFLGTEENPAIPRLERPKAEYSNRSPLGIASAE